MIKWGSWAACLFLIGAGVLLGYRYLRALPDRSGLGEETGPNFMEDSRPVEEDTVPFEPAETTEPGTSGSESQEKDIDAGDGEEGKELYAADGLLRIPLTEWRGGGMGFEGVMYHNIGELEDSLQANPWNENCDIATLPVYRNGTHLDGAGTPWGLCEEEMLALLERAAEDLGVGILEINKKWSTMVGAEDLLTGLSASVDREGWKLEVSANGEVEFRVDEMPLPVSWERTERLESYLLEEFSDLLHFQLPVSAVRLQRSSDHEMGYYYYAYDGAGSMEEQILNAAFRYSRLYATVTASSGLNGTIRLYDWLIKAEKLGDYPIITAEEAKERLLQGKYVTSVPYEIPGEDYVSAVELVYRDGPLEDYYLPYYCFWVDLSPVEPIKEEPESYPNGAGEEWRCQEPLVTYGAYYVPALPEEYLTNLTVYDGRFN